MQRHEADEDVRDEQADREPLDLVVVEVIGKLDHGDLPRKATEPNEQKEGRNSVELVMNDLVLLIFVDFEDEDVVDIEAAEDLNCEACAEQNEADCRQEVICVHARVESSPVYCIFVVGWTATEEYEEADQDEDAANVEAEEI